MSTADFWERAITEEWATSDEAKARTAMLNESQLRRRSLTPDRVPDIYRDKPEGTSPLNRLEFPHEEMWDKELWWKDARMWDPQKKEAGERFSEQIELMWHYGGGGVSLEWLVAQDPDDLQTLNTGDYNLDRDTLDWIMEHEGAAKEFFANRKSQLDQQQNFINDYIKDRERNRNFADIVSTVHNFIPGAGGTTPTPSLPEPKELRAQAQQAWDEFINSEAEGDVDIPEPGFWSRAGNWVLNEITETADSFSEGSRAALWALGGQNQITSQGLTNAIQGEDTRVVEFTDMWEQADINNSKALEQVSAKYDTDVEVIETAREVSGDNLEALFNDEQAMEEILPGVRQTQLDMFGGNVTLATISFVQAGKDALLEAEDQVLLDLGQEIYDMEMEALQENDYKATGWILNALGAWDKYLAGQVGTGLLLFATDDDARDLITTGKIGEFHELIVENDYRPSSVLGWEDSFGGLMLDLSVSVAFDPANLFAPPGLKAAGKLRNVKAAGRMVRKGPIKPYVDDMIRGMAEGNQALFDNASSWILRHDPDIHAEIMGYMAKSTDELGDVIGPGVTAEQSAKLRKLAEEGVTPSAGDVSGVGEVLKREALARAESPNMQPVYSTTDIADRVGDIKANGTVYTPMKFNEGGAQGIIWVGKDNSVGAMVRWNEGGGAGWWKNPKVGKSSIIDDTVEIVRTAPGMGNSKVSELLLASAADSSITPVGAKAVTKQTRKFVDETAGGVGMAVAREMDGATREAIEELVIKALQEGATPSTMRANALAAAMGNKVRKSIAEGGDAARYFQHFRTTRLFRTNSAEAYKEFFDNIYYIWGNNTEHATKWVSRVTNARRRSANAAMRMMEDPDFTRLQRARRMLAENEEAMRAADIAEDVASMQAANNDLWEMVKSLTDKVSRRYSADLVNNPLEDLMKEMWDDYNREVLAHMDAWKPYVGEDGMVPWNVLRGPGGTVEIDELVPSGISGLMDDVDATSYGAMSVQALERRIDRLMGGAAPNVTVPLSPYDMALASSVQHAENLVRLQQKAYARATRDAYHHFDRLWKLDKIARVSTAAVVSFDELMRVWHLYGNDAAMQYMKDKAMFASARAKALKYKKINKDFAWDDLSPKQQARIQELQDIPSYISEAEMLTYERIGQAARVIEPGQPGYKTAAREFYRQFTTDPAFLAALKGEEAFDAFWQSDAALDIRKGTAMTRSGAEMLNEQQQMYQGYQAMIDVLTRSTDAGATNKIKKALIDAAENAASGGQGYLPSGIFEFTPAVKGYQRAGFQSGMHAEKLINGPTEFLLDSFFMEPTNYRRGLMYNIAHEAEMTRLYELYAQRGVRVISDSEFLKLINAPSDMSLSQLSPDVVDRLAKTMGHDRGQPFVLERTLKNRAASSAQDEMQNAFFAWDEGSKFGAAAKNVAPFGGPWADMWGFWGRELLSKPVLRGSFSEGSFMEKLQRGVHNYTPVNPRAVSTISRVANQDLSVEFGENEVDISPLFFFPTRDDHPLRTMIPGIGIVPMFLLDRLVEFLYDPVEEPAEYQKLVEAISDFLPQADYMTGNTASDIFGGGNVSSAYRVGNSISSGISGQRTDIAVMGNYSEAIETNRAISAAIAPELDDLLALRDKEAIRTDVQAIISRATRSTAAKQLGTNVTRWIIPARVDFDPMVDELHEVWIDWARDSEFMSDLNIPSNESLSGEDARNLTGDIRDRYFKLSDSQREQAILENPALAINVVGNWVWSDNGRSKLGFEANQPYRSGGSEEEALRHQTYVEKGWIQPIAPHLKATLTLGVVMNARHSAAKNIYTETIEAYNDQTWNLFSSFLEPQMQSFIDQYGDEYGINDPKRLWEQLGSYESDFEAQWVMDVLEVDPDSEQGKLLQTALPSNIKKDFRAWGTQWRGTPRKDFGPLNISSLDLPEETRNKMELLGIELNDSLTGAQLHQGVENVIGGNPGAKNAIGQDFEAWLRPLGASTQNAKQALREAADDDRYDYDFRYDVDEFMVSADNAMDTVDRRGYRLQSDILEVHDKFKSLILRSDDEQAFRDIWADGYEDRFGPLEWEAPTPPELWDGDRLQANAYQPKIRSIVDGDTIVVEHDTTLFDLKVRGRGLELSDMNTGLKKIRIIGLRARDYGIDDEGAEEDERALRQALLQARTNGDSIFLVTDPDTVGGNTDRYGRELAWLFIGDEAYYSEEAFLPTD